MIGTADRIDTTTPAAVVSPVITQTINPSPDPSPMENRFGFKDLIFTVLLIAILVSVWLSMNMFNRQYDRIVTLERKVDQQDKLEARMERTLNAIQSELNQGLVVQSTTQPADNPPEGEPKQLTVPEEKNPFARVREARNYANYAEGDWLVDAFGANVARITPLVSSDVYGTAIQRHVLESLADRDPDTLEWQPLLAESWTIEDNTEAWQAYVDKRQAEPLTEDEIRQEAGFPKDAGEDEQQAYIDQRMKQGRRIDDIADEPDAPHAVLVRFQLRKDVLFSDGEPMTAEDVQYTWDLTMNPDINAPRARNYLKDYLSNVEATGEYEVTFTFKQPYFEFFGIAASFDAMPKHFYSQFTAEQFNSMPGLLLGTGPYALNDPQSWTPGKPLVLYRNERYWGVKPAFDRLLYKEITNDVARLTDFRNGDIDRFSAQPQQYVELIDDENILAKADPYNYERPNSGYFYVAWAQERNGQPTIFADKRVRQAMTMLIDRQRIVDNIVKGYGKIVTGPFNPLSDQYDHDIEPWPYDPQRAKALLKEAGFADRNSDGVIEDPNGNAFRFELIYPSAGERWARIALLIKDTLAQAGIIVDARGLEWSVFGEKLRSGDLDAIALGWSGGIETDVHQMFHSSNAGGGADNFVYYRNPKLDRLIEQARRTLDDDQRMKIWQQVHHTLHEDQPYTFLYTADSLIFIDKRIQNVGRTRLGLNSIYEWYVPAELQKY